METGPGTGIGMEMKPVRPYILLKASWLSIPEMQCKHQQDSHEWYLHIFLRREILVGARSCSFSIFHV
jgi:hypothetical protein